jgi:hypothetical protein
MKGTAKAPNVPRSLPGWLRVDCGAPRTWEKHAPCGSQLRHARAGQARTTKTHSGERPRTAPDALLLPATLLAKNCV